MSPTILSLPEFVLIDIFQQFSHWVIRHVLSLVCKRFLTIARSPYLLNKSVVLHENNLRSYCSNNEGNLSTTGISFFLNTGFFYETGTFQKLIVKQPKLSTYLFLERNLIDKFQTLELEFDRSQDLIMLENFPESEVLRLKLISVTCSDKKHES